MKPDSKHFYQMSYEERLEKLKQQTGLSLDQVDLLKSHFDETGAVLIENYLTNYQLPEGIVPNLRVNGKNYWLPLVTEEPSVIAAASHGAKLLSADNGIEAQAGQRLVEGQVIVQTTAFTQLDQLIRQQQISILAVADQSHPSLKKYGGGAKKVVCRQLDESLSSVEIQVAVGEAMGANIVNTMAEAVANLLEQHKYQVVMSILSNAGTYQMVTVTGQVAVTKLAKKGLSGAQVANKIATASHIAQIDSKRAVTHNKGIMNGIDALVMALGNDWRAVESAIHLAAVVDNQYRGLSQWQVQGDKLVGTMTIPLPLGMVGGATKVLPLARINRQIANVTTVNEAMQVGAALGLAQNLAALVALVTEGIQRGHMSLQVKSLALANGATPAEIPVILTKIGSQQPDATEIKMIITAIRNSKGE